ncbi:CAF17-like 4Fe-4S cluster assembly/insertion protein YgfZ [Marinomonas transparens]|uniref:Folate-binding protein YgfZ n=1 Tax=Marinomonas transparens TaxID=2795388 RepID=A0A934JTC0_9GAMM|nr:folate-binding protein YgfZ [Marinomonas transparens]MBJ7536929.1 folate-binding protein YgfZ [Marinomonas transparens]
MNSLSTLTSELLQDGVIAQQKHIGVLQITGTDAKKLLQGQTTCNITQLSDSQSLYGAICNIKGRIVTNFFLLQEGENLLMLMDKNLVEKTLLHLKKYAVFFKTELVDATQDVQIYSHFQAANETTPDSLSEILPSYTENGAIVVEISDFPSKQSWVIQATSSNTIDEVNTKSADVLSLLTARPLITSEQSEETLPQWLNMQRTGGISFTKGCYTGQEIVARMQYRGKSKKQLALFSWQGDLDHSKALLNEAGKSIGQVFNVAYVQDTYVAQVILNVEPDDATHFVLDDKEISLLPLPYRLEVTKD